MQFRISVIAFAMVISLVVFSLSSAAAQDAAPQSAARQSAARQSADEVPAAEAEQPAMAAEPAPATETPVFAGEQQAAARQPEDERTVGEAFLLKLRQGGLTMVFLFLASVAGVGFTIERLVNLRTKAVVPEGLAEEAHKLWQNGEFEQMKKLPEKKDSTLARALAVIARHRHSSMADVSMMAGDVASRDLRRHVQKAYPLAVVATVSPLLGLLGTVIGMIGAFDKVAAAGSLGDASLLGGDISKALITTGAGLTIAVPALVLYHYFKSRTNQLALMVEEELGELIGVWYGTEPDQAPAAGESADES
ncbi:MAG: MotA/TolQ/ExbB proton channel family protein [Candidatus Brocadiia bacterium]